VDKSSARRSMLKPDPTRFPRVVHTRVNGPEWLEPDVGESASEPSEVIEFHRPDALPADLALDLRLHEMLEEALLATAATGAVIALASGDQMVCRATAGEKSPKTGVHLNTHSGLSGLCIQTREMQRCDDSWNDTRVNTAACRDLGIRSIVVMPVLREDKLWGILEVFSSIPHAFGESDIEGLRVPCRRVALTVREAVENGIGTPEGSLGAPTDADFAPEGIANEVVRATTQMAAASRRRDYRTTALTAAVIALALLLGWMVGRVGWSMAVSRSATQLPPAPEEAQAGARTAPPTLPPSPTHEEIADTIKPAEPLPRPVPPKATVKPKPPSAEPAGGLVVYENGKVVFRMEPGDKSPPAADQSNPVQDAAEREERSSTGSAAASPLVGKSYLLERVEPQYPEAAKAARIQGPVVLSAFVGRDGAVRKVEVVSGDPQLVKAAADAVRQWRFKPHLVKGEPIEFETRITVNFQLP